MVKKCRDHLQATQGLEWSRLFSTETVLSPPPPLYKEFYLALVSSRLGMILEQFGMPIITWSDDPDDSTTMDENSSPEGACEKMSYPISTPGAAKTHESKWIINPTYWVDLLKSSGGSY